MRMPDAPNSSTIRQVSEQSFANTKLYRYCAHIYCKGWQRSIFLYECWGIFQSHSTTRFNGIIWDLFVRWYMIANQTGSKSAVSHSFKENSTNWIATDSQLNMSHNFDIKPSPTVDVVYIKCQMEECIGGIVIDGRSFARAVTQSSRDKFKLFNPIPWKTTPPPPTHNPAASLNQMP